MILTGINKEELSSYVPLFDFDNTIINEIDYIFPIFKETLNQLDLNNLSKQDLIDNFVANYQINGSEKIIDKLEISEENKITILDKYIFNLRKERMLKDKLECNATFINYVNSEYFSSTIVHIITNGNEKQQKNKFKNTDFNKIDREINFICANEFAPKPEIKSFIDNFTYQKNYLFIGDSEVDIEYAENIGIYFMHINELRKIFL